MKTIQYDDVIKSSMLFHNVEDNGDVGELLRCLSAEVAEFKKGEYILLAGDKVKSVGLLLSGQLSIIKEDLDGERTLISQLSPGDIFAEALTCAGVEFSPVTVVSDVGSVVLLLDFHRILRVCRNTCNHHSKLIENMMMILARKNLYLQERMEFLSKKTIRKKLMKYLWRMSDKNKDAGGFFAIPYSREELADYLCVDRSALSRELSNLKNEGEIDFWKNQFKIL